ncbi:hypothetical protein DFJ58DRAFT_722734 [Suillus subalutaceus]|uniref:uncharacterized protein n=1 Tax=Suillus subalutaceus TaxID=48586 RepID=UPI001B865982|nr:uncharacterized protein DFJ58DRAFT_722734 [Suillus subalutaceus]KAG1871312.1 hypothetical protein DFJ58DRAFT_722734 [Suillus subalutaceus]
MLQVLLEYLPGMKRELSFEIIKTKVIVFADLWHLHYLDQLSVENAFCTSSISSVIQVWLICLQWKCRELSLKFLSYFIHLMFISAGVHFLAVFEAVFCYFFIVETRNRTLEATAAYVTVTTVTMTARFDPHSFFLSIFDSDEGMAQTHENGVAHTGLAPKLESDVTTTH